MHSKARTARKIPASEVRWRLVLVEQLVGARSQAPLVALGGHRGRESHIPLARGQKKRQDAILKVRVREHFRRIGGEMLLELRYTGCVSQARCIVSGQRASHRFQRLGHAIALQHGIRQRLDRRRVRLWKDRRLGQHGRHGRTQSHDHVQHRLPRKNKKWARRRATRLDAHASTGQFKHDLPLPPTKWLLHRLLRSLASDHTARMRHSPKQNIPPFIIGQYGHRAVHAKRPSPIMGQYESYHVPHCTAAVCRAGQRQCGRWMRCSMCQDCLSS